MLCNRFLLVVCFIYSSVYMSIPISQFIPLPLSSLITISWFSTSLTLLLLQTSSFVWFFFLRFHLINDIIWDLSFSNLFHSASLVAHLVKNSTAMQETPVRFWVRKILWRRKWQPNPVFSPGKFHGQRSLIGYSPWGGKESDMTDQLGTNDDNL